MAYINILLLSLASHLAFKIASLFQEGHNDCAKDNAIFVSLLLKAVRTLKCFIIINF